MSYHFGCRKDPPHKRTQKDARLLLGTSSSTPSTYSLESFECPILDQGRCEGCLGHGTPQGVYTTLNAAGATMPWVASPRALYALLRSLEAAQTPGFDPNNPPPLTDIGGMPADVMTAISQWGVCPTRAPSPDGRNSDIWTPDDVAGIVGAPAANVNDRASLLDIETSGQKLLVGEYRIDETASDVITVMRGVIANSKASIGIGAFVDSSVMNWTLSAGPLSSANLQDPNGGGHWICVTSYSTMSNGKTVFRIANSWGASYGDAGHFEVTEDWIRAAVSDIYPFTVKSAA